MQTILTILGILSFMPAFILLKKKKDGESFMRCFIPLVFVIGILFLFDSIGNMKVENMKYVVSLSENYKPYGRCPDCTERIDLGKKTEYCTKCGRKTTSLMMSTKTDICPECKTVEKGNHCKKCGSKIIKTTIEEEKPIPETCMRFERYWWVANFVIMLHYTLACLWVALVIGDVWEMAAVLKKERKKT